MNYTVVCIFCIVFIDSDAAFILGISFGCSELKNVIVKNLGFCSIGSFFSF